MDAGRLSQDADPPDRPACAFRDRGPVAGGQLDHPRPHAGTQGDPAGQGAGRGRARALPLQRRRNAGRQPRRAVGRAACREDEIFVHLQLSDAELGRHRGGRLAGRWRGDHEPGAAATHLLRPLQPRDDPHLQGRKLPPAAGLRHHDEDGGGHPGTEGNGAGCAQPLLVSGADDVWPVRQGFGPFGAVDGMEDQDQHQ
ncbi:UNVERIFIED_CONTAM: hypothetical protein NCL1_00498 [Trichonephila clavipes]